MNEVGWQIGALLVVAFLSGISALALKVMSEKARENADAVLVQNIETTRLTVQLAVLESTQPLLLRIAMLETELKLNGKKQ